MKPKQSNKITQREGLAYISGYVPDTIGKWFRIKAAKLGLNKTELLTLILSNAKASDTK